MALIYCPECSEKISSAAKVCIHCGFPIGQVIGANNKCIIDGVIHDLTTIKDKILSSNPITYETNY